MGRHSLYRRLDRVEARIAPQGQRNTITIVELYRLVWEQNRTGYMKLIQENDYGARLLLSSFEREDATRHRRESNVARSGTSLTL